VNIGDPSRHCYLPPASVPADIDYEMWLGPAPWAPYHPDRIAGDYSPPAGWRWIRDYSGGAMTDWGAHHFDIAQWGLGMDGTQPVEIYPPDGKDFETLTFRYANGVWLYHRGAEGVKSKGVRFIGAEGWIDVGRGSLITHPASLKDRPIAANDQRLYYSEDHLLDWIDCMRTRRRPICDVEIGASSVIVCHLGVIGYDLGRPLKWSPENRRFEGDAEANRLLDRAAREPWAL
jgi:predicted dehydrogenase